MALVFYLFAFIERSESSNQKRPLTRLERLALTGIGLVGVLTLAFTVGHFSAGEDYLVQSMLGGGVVGLLLARIVVGRPRLHRNRR